MLSKHLDLFVCPCCAGELALADGAAMSGEHIESGWLTCGACHQSYEIVRRVPRFVSRDNYGNSFGWQWQAHARTQYDSHTGGTISEERFFKETGWPRDLRGATVLEVGCGSGRFTELVARTGALLVSIDISAAVDVNQALNGANNNIVFAQCDLNRLPFRRHCFDRVFCFGVLQHTPNVEAAFRALLAMPRPGGHVVADVYARQPWYKHLVNTKYWVRPLTRRMSAERLHRWVSRYITLMWPATKVISRCPLGRRIALGLLICDYRGRFELDDDQLRDWAILDSFDMLSSAYDQPQSIETVRRWVAEGGLHDAQVQYGYNGIEIRACVPSL
ncbi:methyltransferase domain-containing protein [Ideonella sp. A 288]|uniref:methyltransferase domain-containing protein n=1 Tax=Ideonella sp. A 288 TaxID=1962181 RepID=UPI000B4C1A2B|nr:methyltransferase domain-containing protein [Ideonella sp. A 288]